MNPHEHFRAAQDRIVGKLAANSALEPNVYERCAGFEANDYRCIDPGFVELYKSRQAPLFLSAVCAITPQASK